MVLVVDAFLVGVDLQRQRLKLLRIASRQKRVLLLLLLEVFVPALERFLVESFFGGDPLGVLGILQPRRGLQILGGFGGENLAELGALRLQEFFDGLLLIVHLLLVFIVGGDHVLRRQGNLVICRPAEDAQQRIVI